MAAREGAFVGRGFWYQTFDRGKDFSGFSHAALSRLATFGHLARIRPDEVKAVRLQQRVIAPCRGMGPHARVHGGRHQDRLVGRHQHGGGEVIGMPAGHPGHQVGGGRRDDDQVRLA